MGGVGLKQYDIIYNVGTGEENDKSDFWLLQNRVTNFENEISKKDTIIDYLTSQLFASKIISYSDKKNLHRDDDNDDTNDKRTPRAQGSKERNNKQKLVATGDSSLNGINECGVPVSKLVIITTNI